MMKHKPEDEIAVGPEIAPDTYIALRRHGDEVRRVLVRPAKDGAPLSPGAELARLGDTTSDPWRELVLIYKHDERERRATEDGPAQVATPAYRKGYERIFGKKTKVGIA